MMGVFVDRVLPPHLKCESSDTTVATQMRRHLAAKDKATLESLGSADSSKHELTCGFQYGHMHFHTPPSRYAGDRVSDNVA